MMYTQKLPPRPPFLLNTQRLGTCSNSLGGKEKLKEFRLYFVLRRASNRLYDCPNSYEVAQPQPIIRFLPFSPTWRASASHLSQQSL